ncbi:flagellar hook-length control protein FliK [Salinispirillum marinum]|uniref:Flagellar hook-length control protein FliK n=3 Tax=Saccharospirillaceae TaxID=255527 RepID=A0ABV8BHV9_9GAMM
MNMVVSMLDNVLSISPAKERSQPRAPEAAHASASAQRPAQSASSTGDKDRFDQHYAAARRDQSAVGPLRKEPAPSNPTTKNGKESPQATSGDDDKGDEILPLESASESIEPVAADQSIETADRPSSNMAITIDIVHRSTDAMDDADSGDLLLSDEKMDGELAISELSALDTNSVGDGQDEGDRAAAGDTDAEQANTLLSGLADDAGELSHTETDASTTANNADAPSTDLDPILTALMEQADSDANPLVGEADVQDDESLEGDAEAAVSEDGDALFDPTLGMAKATKIEGERAGQPGANPSNATDNAAGRTLAAANSGLTAAIAEQALAEEQVTVRQPLDATALRETSVRPDTDALIKQHLERDFPVRQSATEVTHRLSERLVLMVSRDIQQATIRLDPPELGKMDIQIKTNGDQVQVQVVTQQPMVRDLLEQQAFRLREMLEQQGFAKVDVNVSDQSQRDHEQARHGEGGQGQGDGTEDGDWAERPTPVRQTVGLVDHYV